MKTPKNNLVALNFSVPPEFRKELKLYAAEKGVHMVEILKAGYELYKREEERAAREKQ